jgi:Uma2 family endonuclease
LEVVFVTAIVHARKNIESGLTESAKTYPEMPLRRLWTREDYYHAADVGIFAPDEKLELIEGEILTMSPVGSQHSVTVLRTFQFLVQAFGKDYHINIQEPITLSDMTEPEPDVIVAIGESGLYEDHHPTPAELRLVVEVSDTTLVFDKTRKAALYNTCGVPEYWIVNLPLRQIEVFRDPRIDSEYQTVIVATENDTISPLHAPLAKIQVAGLLPRNRA